MLITPTSQVQSREVQRGRVTEALAHSGRKPQRWGSNPGPPTSQPVVSQARCTHPEGADQVVGVRQVNKTSLLVLNVKMK